MLVPCPLQSNLQLLQHDAAGESDMVALRTRRGGVLHLPGIVVVDGNDAAGDLREVSTSVGHSAVPALDALVDVVHRAVVMPACSHASCPDGRDGFLFCLRSRLALLLCFRNDLRIAVLAELGRDGLELTRLWACASPSNLLVMELAPLGPISCLRGQAPGRRGGPPADGPRRTGTPPADGPGLQKSPGTMTPRHDGGAHPRHSSSLVLKTCSPTARRRRWARHSR